MIVQELEKQAEEYAKSFPDEESQKLAKISFLKGARGFCLVMENDDEVLFNPEKTEKEITKFMLSDI